MDRAWYQKKYVIFLAVVIVIFTVLAVSVYAYRHRDRRTYCMDQPAIETVEGIVIEQNANGVVYKETEDIKHLLKTIYGVKMITGKESVQDSPVNVEDEIAIHISLSDKKVITLFAYKKHSKYFIEMPYNGIYEIEEETYNILKEHLK